MFRRLIIGAVFIKQSTRFYYHRMVRSNWCVQISSYTTRVDEDRSFHAVQGQLHNILSLLTCSQRPSTNDNSINRQLEFNHSSVSNSLGKVFMFLIEPVKSDVTSSMSWFDGDPISNSNNSKSTGRLTLNCQELVLKKNLLSPSLHASSFYQVWVFSWEFLRKSAISTKYFYRGLFKSY